MSKTQFPRIINVGSILAIVTAGESYSDNAVILYSPAIDEVVGKVHVSVPQDAADLLKALAEVIPATKEAADATQG